MRWRASGSARFGRFEVAVSVPDSAAPCGGATSDRLRRVRATEARRAWIERQGEADPATPVWLSRDGWLDDVRAWAASPDFAAVCGSVRVSITSATVVAVAVAWADSADHGTGRYAAVTRERIAEKIGCAIKTVSRAWKVLGAAGWAVEAARGHGSAGLPSAGKRPSIWHLVSRRPAVPAVADTGENVPLPPKAGSCLLPPVGNNSPSVRERTREEISTPNQTHPPRSRRRWRATPRPLAVQRLAAGLAVATHGLDKPGRTHIGALCDAIDAAGIDALAWTPKALTAALNADMRATGWSWPDRIERPGAFLASRLCRLPARPDRSGPVLGGTAAGLEQSRRAPVEPSATPVPPVAPTAPEPVQTAAGPAYARRLFAEQRQRRLTDASAPQSAAVLVRQSAPHGPHGAPRTAPCATCGCADAPRRRFLPAHRSHVCDACWDAAPDQAGA